MALGDVVEDHDDAHDISVVVADGGGAVVDRRFRAVLGDEDGVVGEADDRAQADGLVDRAFDELACLFVDNVEHVEQRSADRVGGRPAGHPLGDGVHVRDAGGGVGGDHGVADAAERSGEPRPLPGHLALGGVAVGHVLDGEQDELRRVVAVV